MPRRSEELTLLEQTVMLAVLRLHPNGYGVNIRDEIEHRIGKKYGFGPLYAVLERLEDDGLIKPRQSDPSERGRRKTYFELTGTGQKALSASLSAIDTMRRGVLVPMGA